MEDIIKLQFTVNSKESSLIYLIFSWLFLKWFCQWYLTCQENARTGATTKTGNSLPQLKAACSILDVCESNQMFNSQLIDKTTFLVLIYIAFIGFLHSINRLLNTIYRTVKICFDSYMFNMFDSYILDNIGLICTILY